MQNKKIYERISERFENSDNLIYKYKTEGEVLKILEIIKIR